MTPRIVLLCTTLLLASCALLAPAPTTTIPTPQLRAGEELYIIDPAHTFPSFEISHFAYSTHRGRFNKTSGWVVLDRGAHRGAIELAIDANSVDTGDPVLEQRLRAEDFLDTETYPSITFKSDKLRFDGETLVAVDGMLTLRGVTRPVTLTVTSFRCGKRQILVITQNACGANAETRIKRSDFGLLAYPSMIGDDMKLLIQVEALKP